MAQIQVSSKVYFKFMYINLKIEEYMSKVWDKTKKEDDIKKKVEEVQSLVQKEHF